MGKVVFALALAITLLLGACSSYQGSGASRRVATDAAREVRCSCKGGEATCKPGYTCNCRENGEPVCCRPGYGCRCSLYGVAYCLKGGQ